jgi:hypothetical protein
VDREDILRMADEAYELAKKDLLNGNYLTKGFLAIRDIHFHRLATAAEREKVAEWMIEHGYATGHGDTVEELLKELEWQIREREREECAKIADKRNREENSVADRIARKIRARDEQKVIKWEIEP